MPNIKTIQQKKDTAYGVKAAAPDSVQIMDVDLTKKVVTGLYNSFNYFDSDQDVLLWGSSQKSINERGPESTSVQKIKHLLYHNWTMLPGKIQLLEERKLQDISGIYFETKMTGTQLGIDTLINYQEKVYDNHSIGFRYMDGEFVDSESDAWKTYVQMLINPDDAEKAGYMFVWKEIMLLEGSTVAFGANKLTPYLGVKSENKPALAMKITSRIEILTKQLSSGKQSDETMQLFEMELLQMKQYINELFTDEPSIKDTLLQQGRQQKDTQGNEELIDLTKLSTFKLF